jgi:hypothetical protein
MYTVVLIYVDVCLRETAEKLRIMGRVGRSANQFLPRER